MQVEKEITLGEERRNTQKQEESSENVLPEEKVLLSVSQSQTEKLEAISHETLNTQDTQEDLESPVGYVDQIQRTEVGQVQGLKTKYEVASQLPVTSENLPALHPTIGDIISHFDMDKVVETDLEQLRDAFGQHLQKDEFKTLSPSLPETGIDQFTHEAERDKLKSEFKSQLKNHPETEIEHLKDTIGQGLIKDEIQTQSKNYFETDTKPLGGIIGKSLMKEPMKTQLKRHPETDTEHLTNVFRRGKVFGGMKTQPQSHPDFNIKPLIDAITRGIIKGSDRPQLESQPDTDKERLADIVGESTIKGPMTTQLKILPGVSLLKNKDMFIQHQKDISNKHPALSKLPTKLFVENEGVNLLKNKDISMQLQEGTKAKQATPNKFPTKVINLSPFAKEENFDDSSPYSTEPPKATYNTSRTASQPSRFTPFPSLNKMPSGKPKISLNQKSVKLPNAVPTVTTKKPTFKVGLSFKTDSSLEELHNSTAWYNL
ncbi:PREDICTED: uncharacterized protein C10orf68 homolog isoform X4 [Chinchilla lanigera]|nr:PREDICTED: uncharacterized protein C10orf68 homolog isoform X4 [Chinchilla lanigera]XP_013376922.1 PREDICTED: uncharacterized protein C10orf68 homolog isoform X4 [Chinchilla lanigera]XP_013376923.1 PREDICTED: uncharacterized protein C10orf68 homolog isoform X4 [Chinchilla lanigera]XP_013376924.1 PREDICTED: uncharacterized protein C10orf68 homolog isoform X4 [Chinchilla lanigera]